MGKVILIAVLAMIAWRMLAGHWPWQASAAARERKLAAARRLLGVPRLATREEVQAAHRRRLASVHPDRGGSNAEVHEANAARDLLLAQLPHGLKEEA
jgi:DnaJ homolog subfamily C member 19